MLLPVKLPLSCGARDWICQAAVNTTSVSESPEILARLVHFADDDAFHANPGAADFGRYASGVENDLPTDGPVQMSGRTGVRKRGAQRLRGYTEFCPRPAAHAIPLFGIVDTACWGLLTVNGPYQKIESYDRTVGFAT